MKRVLRNLLLTGLFFSISFLNSNCFLNVSDGIKYAPLFESSDFTSIIPKIGEWVNVTKTSGAIEYQINWQPVKGADGYEFVYDFEIASQSEQMIDTPGTAYTVGFQNTVNLKGKVRAYKKESGQKIYTQWSNTSYKSWDTINQEIKNMRDAELGSYVALYDMHLRSEPNKNSNVKGDISEGTNVDIVEIKNYGNEKWGRTSDGKWICISDKDYTYLAKKNTNSETYRTNYEMTLRSEPSRNSTAYGTIDKGTTVSIVDTYSDGDGTWGKTSDGKWICISDKDYKYLTKQ